MSDRHPLRDRFTNTDQVFPDEVLVLSDRGVFHMPAALDPTDTACDLAGGADPDDLRRVELAEDTVGRACFHCFQQVLRYFAALEDSPVERHPDGRLDDTSADESEPRAHDLLIQHEPPEEHPAASRADGDG